MFAVLLFSLVLFYHGDSAYRIVNRPNSLPEDGDYWMSEMKNVLEKKMKTGMPNTKRAKNVIIFVGDGMGLPVTVASRIYKGQLQGLPGEETSLKFETFPSTGLIKSYCVDRQVPDSACTATAMFSGIKSRYYTMGVDVHTNFDDCQSSLENADYHPDSIIVWAKEQGKKTGLVTTMRVTHATPGALYCHTPNRDWECEEFMPQNAKDKCLDIARQLIEKEPGQYMNVILGGGQRYFQPDIPGACKRIKNVNLTQLWIDQKKRLNLTWAYVKTREELMADGNEKKDHVLGLFAGSHMSYELDRQKNPSSTQPSIQEMTRFAIRNMKNDQGFFLMVEGGNIDYALHDVNAKRAMVDLLAMEDAVATAMKEMESELDETLIIVTADHSHVMTINGYPKRGNPILGISEVSVAMDLPYTTLMFTNGGYWKYKVDPKNSSQVVWQNFTQEEAMKDDYHQMQAVYIGGDLAETHGGEDIAVYATGPWSHLLVGVNEQSYIAHVMAYAACIGPHKTRDGCDEHIAAASNPDTTDPDLIAAWIGLYKTRESCDDDITTSITDAANVAKVTIVTEGIVVTKATIVTNGTVFTCHYRH
ncbi:unnamed protein product [Darwinula stevensoni]|uniref:Alkaline phosphatase n=1 Tax=Darwinula stevensoni TaxID=69355 RepID=A0A7R8XJG6_9CRUS|nr:unnamed protein product [Darwinula stevensoni]CAG0894801.1 unnamed protein product [Darwinula stevensoni]